MRAAGAGPSGARGWRRCAPLPRRTDRPGSGWRPGEGSEAAAMAAALLLCSALLCAALGCAGAALIPPADVKVEVLHKPFLCHRKTKWGDMMLVHYEGFLERDGSMFHST